MEKMGSKVKGRERGKVSHFSTLTFIAAVIIHKNYARLCVSVAGCASEKGQLALSLG